MIAITGATGYLGQLTIQALLYRSVPAAEIVAIVRTPEKASALVSKGVQVREADYTQPKSLNSALRGVNKLLSISSNDVANRVISQQNVVEAARQAGVELIAYTSILGADTATMCIAEDHYHTESAIRASGLPFVFLRNGWYLENYNVARAAEHGMVTGSAGDGRVSAAARADYAEAAAAVLSQDGHGNTIYELGGDESFTLSELATEVQTQSGRPVRYQNLPEAEYAALLGSFGLPKVLAEKLADADSKLKLGELHVTTGHLSRLIGRPTTSLSASIKAGLHG